jgi:LPS O-antigen subunit length determinant protein (WzzB/FepE family)
MNINNINLDDDEIDLRDFFVTLWKKKLLLLFLTSVFAIFSNLNFFNAIYNRINTDLC